MPTFREDLHLGHKITLWETDDIRNRAINSAKIALRAIITELIADFAITTEKLGEQSVTTSKIADLAVITSKLADLAVTTAKLADESVTTEKIHSLAVITGKIADLAVTTEKLGDLSVTTEKLGDEAVTNEKIHDLTISWQKLNADLQNIIASREEGGVALSTEWGNSELIGITQKKLSEAHADLQNQINSIINDKATVNLNATPSPIFVGVQREITLTATTNTQATSIQIKKGSTVLATGSGLTLGGTDTITPSAAGNTAYTALFTIAGLQKTASKNVVAVYPIYYGALETYNSENLTQLNTPSTTVKGTYSIELDTTPKKIYFKVPKGNVTGVSKVELLSDGNYSPVGGSVDASLGDENYNVWVSDDAYNVESAGNRSFVVNR